MRNRSIQSLLLFASVVLSSLPAYSQDSTPPTVISQLPAAGAAVVQLNQVEVFFSEDVQGVDAGDLMINGVAATNVFMVQASQYRFQFTQPANGLVQVSWIAGSGITDLANPANAFAGGSWTYTLDPALAFNSIRINEFMAANDTGIRDEDGDHEDWIEIYNGSPIAVELGNCFLTDDRSQLDLWRFPSFAMAPNTYLIIWASGKNRTNPAAVLHTNFKLDPDSGYLAFVGPQTNAVSDFGLSYPQQRTDVSYGRDPLDPRITGFYPGTNASPGRINVTAGGAGDFAPDVLASRDSSTFINSFNLALSLSASSPNAVIRYVVINTAAQAVSSVTNVPTVNSPLYTGPIPITQTTQIRARSFEPGKLPGTPVSFSYIQIASSVLSFSSDLPLVILHNFGGGSLPATGDQTAMIATFHSDLDRSSLTNKPDLIGRAGVNDRGSSTQGQTKQNVAVEFWDEFNQDIDRPMLGLPEESDWVLFSINNFDQGLMHNAIFHWFGRTMGYSSRTRYVEVFRKTDTGPITSGDYFGLFLLEEKPKRNKNRVDIEALQPENTNAATVTGGYLLRIDRVDADERTIALPATITGPTASIATLPGGTGLIYDYPNGVQIATDPRRVAQRDYITRYILDFLTNATGANFRDPVTGYAKYIDVDSWVDNSIANIICYNVDGYRLSGYMFKDRDGKLQQGPPWDCDRCLGTGGGGGGSTPSTDSRPFNPRQWRVPTTGIGTDNGTDFFGVSTVAVQWWQPLFRDPDFWQKWIDHYQQFRTNQFTTNAILAMIDGYATEIKEAQAREQVRWPTFTFPRFGVNSANGYSHDFGARDTRFTQGGFYTNEVNFQKRWFVDRMNFFDTNFLNMPVLSAGSGLVSSGTTVNVQAATKPGTIIYYTLDGTDPRLPGGAISPQALANAGNLTLTVTTNIRFFARCYNPNHSNQINTPIIGIGNPLTNSYWSGPVAASYYTAVPPLRITEIMYHPANPPAGNTNDPDNFEYIEVRNIGATPLNVNRFRLSGGVDFDFPNTLLPANGRAVVVRDPVAFTARYGGGITILGSYTNKNLGNDGDHLILEGGFREPILDFEYDDDWYPITDGPGFSLQIVNDAAATTTWGLKTSWRPSGTVGGTPGAADAGVPVIPAIYVNEALTKTDPIPGDAIELYNSTGNLADIGGWYLTDDFGTPQKFRIPAGTSIPANSYIVFYQSNSFGVGSNAFALSSRGDEVYLFSGNASSNLTGWVHGFDFGDQVHGATFGRHIISTAEEHFVTQISPTLGLANSGPKVGPIVISEINYHPPDFTFPLGSLDNDVDEYIELQNISGSPVPLYDTANPSNTWRLRDAVSFTFPQGVTVPASGFVLVVSFTPTNGPALDRFRAANAVPLNTPIYGPWSGKLDNSADSIELTFPDVPDAPGTPSAGFVPYVLADKVAYQDVTPWPEGLADGFGGTLHRNPVAGYGNDPANWRAARKSPGAAIGGGVPPAIVTQPVNTVGVGRYSASFTVAATGTAPLAYQWTFNSNAIYGATGPTLTLNNLRLNQAGTYACYVFNEAGFVLSSNAQLTVLIPVTVTGNPQSVKLRGSTNAGDYGFTSNNVTFSASVATQRPTHYQWYYNGGPIPAATNVSVTISNVDFDLHEGEYYMTAADNLSTDVTAPARLTVLVSPTLIEIPPFTNGPPILVASNGSFSASVVIRGNPPPFYYRWNESSSTRVSATNDLRTNTMVFGPITNFVQRLWRVIVTNEANVAPSATSPFYVGALVDSDRDGIPDEWENQYNLNANSDADRNLDSDGDGASNYAEYFAGTNPTNAASFLRVDLAVIPGQAQIQVGAISNRTYSVQYSDNLTLGLWQNLGTLLSQTNSRTATILDPGWTTNRFYRAITPAQSPP